MGRMRDRQNVKKAREILGDAASSAVAVRPVEASTAPAPAPAGVKSSTVERLLALPKTNPWTAGLAALGGVVGAFAWKKHRIGGSALGALLAGGGGYAIDHFTKKEGAK